MNNNTLKIKLFNVGHGDCILITFPDGKHGLIDTQYDSSNICPAFNEIDKIKHLHFLCLTHPHKDHYSGMLRFLKDSNIKIDNFYHSVDIGLNQALKFHNLYSVIYDSEASFVTNRELLERGGTEDELLAIYEDVWSRSPNFRSALVEGQEIESISDVEIRSLGPTTSTLNRYNKILVNFFKKKNITQKEIKKLRDYANKISLVLYLKYGGCGIILSGDSLSTNWRQMIKFIDRKKIPLATVVKASHHGSKDSFYKDMWKQIINEKGVVLVSCGRPMHPHSEFVTNLNSNGHLIFCTNMGNHCDQNKKLILPPHSAGALNCVSDDISNKCCDWIEVVIKKTGKNRIVVNFGNKDAFRSCIMYPDLRAESRCF